MKFIVYTSGYNENIGGIIVLHQLCHELNSMGESAYLWQRDKSLLNRKKLVRSLYQMIKYYISKILFQNKFKTKKDWITPLASFRDLKGAIVIYPEIISDNPLRAKNVVRWFLNKPGLFKNPINYGKNELYFYYSEAFNDEKINPNSENRLTLVTTMDNIYKQTNFDERKGTCYLMRKGKGRKIVHDLNNSILIDGMSHLEIANIFNRVEKFISYDLYTLYSHYAALCGCTSIVVPESNISEKLWRESHGDKKYGIAYGFENEQIAYAKNTKHNLWKEFEQLKSEQLEMIKSFINKCKNKYSSGNQ
ncbi:MAG: WavQ [Ignavibacteriae bacterium]|nr:WavQ [Ignavibacteriota bacterium]